MPRRYEDAVTYIVRSGDTLSAIAVDHNVTLDELVAANAGRISDPNLIQPGWELVIPGALATAPEAPPAGLEVVEYVVRDGDTLGALAAHWGSSVAEVAELNGIVNPSLIYVGQRLRRPGRSPAPSAPAEAAAPASSVVRGVLEFERYPLDMPPAALTGGFREDYGGYLHRGVDLGHVPVGTPIHAPAGGAVAVHHPGDGWGDGSFGICVVIDHPGTPWWSIYAHMNDTARATGDVVVAGDVIGAVGFTGRVLPEGPAGAHLHWQVSAHADFPTDFQYIANPLDFLRA